MDVNESNVIVALDIGTTKIVALIGEILPDGKIKIIGDATCFAKGVQKGVIVNIKQTVTDIQNVITKAEETANCEVHSLFISCSGYHINSLNSQGIVAIDKEVKKEDVERVLQAAKAISIPEDRELMHTITQNFVVDNQQTVLEPVGMSAVRLQSNVHIITGSSNVLKNIRKCVEDVGLKSDGIVLTQLASEYSILNEDRKSLGVCLIEIGGGTTNVAVFSEGTLQHTTILPIAGNQVTNDIAVAFNLPIINAEQIKKEFGYAKKQLIPQDKVIETKTFNDKHSKRISITKLSEIIQFRYEEIFNLIKIELRKVKLFSKLGAGVILTGGSSNTFAINNLAEDILQMNVEISGPCNVINNNNIKNNPVYSTSVGLLVYGHKLQNIDSKEHVKLGYLAKMKDWLRENL